MSVSGAPGAANTALIDQFSYDDDVVRKFMTATFIWGLVAVMNFLTTSSS